MSITKKIIAAAALLLLAACSNYEDFEFTGKVVYYEICNGISDLGYAVTLSAPDSIGGEYTTRERKTYQNVVIIYGANRILKEGDQISGRIYLDPNYSKTTCSMHYPDRDVPEAVFTKLKVD